MITELLRAGASLDACSGLLNVEDVIKRKESNVVLSFLDTEEWRAIKRVVAGVRKYGTYKRYARSFHREARTVNGTGHSPLSFLALTFALAVSKRENISIGL